MKREGVKSVLEQWEHAERDATGAGGGNAGRSWSQNSDRLICFPVSEESNRNEYRHDPGNGANDYWLHERRLKSKNTLNCRTQAIRQALQIRLQQEPRGKWCLSSGTTF